MKSQAKIIKFTDIIEGRQKESFAYRVRLDFLFGELTCTRDVVVSSQNTLHELHAIMQACGGWMDYHLYHFSFVHGGRLVSAEPSWQAEQFGGSQRSVQNIDSERITLAEAFHDFPSLLYRYDYGDGWEINVLLLGVLENDEMPPKIPYCLSGKGDWPPEDVGGEGGFIRLAEILSDPKNEEHTFMREWADEQGFEKYTRAKCNRNLTGWRDYLQSRE